jgi:hypothetical protein
MGKSDEQQTKKRVHKAADSESKHKNTPSFDATNFEATHDERPRQSQWRDNFRHLCEFKVQFGHCLVPYKYAAHPKLGKWVSNQRVQYRKNKEENSTSTSTKAEHIRALDGIGFDWGGADRTDLASSMWIVRFQQLCEYKVEFGHCRVPQRYADNPKLTQWVKTQRTQYRLHQKGKPSHLTIERIGELHGIGFEWGERCPTWSKLFEQLCEFKLQFGHSLVTQHYAATPKLRRWVSTQRNNYRLHREGKPSRLTTERIGELDGIGFHWGGSRPTWNELFEQLCEFKMQFGHSVVPQHYAATPKLGRWVSTQRSNYRLLREGKPSAMTEEHIRALDGTGFDWGASNTDLAFIWSVRFQELCDFKVQFGNCLVPNKYSANPKLAQWISTQRTQYRKYHERRRTSMTEERIRDLESIGFDWGTTKTDWASIWSVRFQQLCDFKEQFGHYLVPFNYTANPKLGRWVSTQRGYYKLYQEGKPTPLTEDRIRELESVEFDSHARGAYSRAQEC